MTEANEQVVDTLARRIRGTRPTPAHRDFLAMAGVACIVLAIGLWSPLIGLASIGAVLIAVAFLTAPALEEKETSAANDS